VYLRSVLAFSAIGALALYLVQRIQQILPYSVGLPPVEQSLARNTAISFVTNTPRWSLNRVAFEGLRWSVNHEARLFESAGVSNP